MQNKTLIFGILNWGLGHAARSLPIVNELINCGFRVVVCSDGEPLEWMRNELSGVIFEELPTYKVSYTSSVIPWYLSSLPGIAKTIAVENRLLEVLVERYSADFVISDNRLGFYSQKVPSFYITHQLSIQVPRFSHWASKIHAKYINKYTEVWIPDLPSIHLAGQLTENPKVKIERKYIGPLSRYSNLEKVNSELVLGILSGPAEARLKLLDFLLKQNIENLCIVGAPEERVDVDHQIYGILSKDEMGPLLGKAKVIISRCGYSTLMDLMFLKVPALLRPTPGQFEQEYLAEALKDRPHWVIQSESDFDYKSADLQLKKYVEPTEVKVDLRDFLSFLNRE